MCPTRVILCLSVTRSAVLSALHSFPTRRSSDLRDALNHAQITAHNCDVLDGKFLIGKKINRPLRLEIGFESNEFLAARQCGSLRNIARGATRYVHAPSFASLRLKCTPRAPWLIAK